MGKPITAVKKIKRLEGQIFRVRPEKVPDVKKRIQTLKNTSTRRR